LEECLTCEELVGITYRGWWGREFILCMSLHRECLLYQKSCYPKLFHQKRWGWFLPNPQSRRVPFL